MEGPDSFAAAQSAAFAAGCYLATGQLNEAETYLNDANRVVTAFYDEDNATFSLIIGSYGVLYWKQGRLEKAKDCFERALEIRERLFGKNHPNTCGTSQLLSELKLEMNLPENAHESSDESEEKVN